ncbi:MULTISPECIES: hypothetical protein [unclassified Rhizobium]|uniref:hypothetical protein n=1 Tax=unclassified Rhizobium TaxID=2613769 RepID=UPI00295ED607|nr:MULTISPECIES: hypothetical protein [unclassified Rhizobium]
MVDLIPGIELWLAAFCKTAQAKLMLGRIGLALLYATVAEIGTMFLFAANGAAGIKAAGLGRRQWKWSGNPDRVAARWGSPGVNRWRCSENTVRAWICRPRNDARRGRDRPRRRLRTARRGDRERGIRQSRTAALGGKRAVHGEAAWMKVQEAAKLFPDLGGIVVGERYRVDRASVFYGLQRSQQPYLQGVRHWLVLWVLGSIRRW